MSTLSDEIKNMALMEAADGVIAHYRNAIYEASAAGQRMNILKTEHARCRMMHDASDDLRFAVRAAQLAREMEAYEKELLRVREIAARAKTDMDQYFARLNGHETNS